VGSIEIVWTIAARQHRQGIMMFGNLDAESLTHGIGGDVVTGLGLAVAWAKDRRCFL